MDTRRPQEAEGGLVPVRPFDAHGRRLGIFVLAYNAEKLLADTLRRIPEDVWNAVVMLSGLRMSAFHSGYRGYSTRFLRRVPHAGNNCFCTNSNESDLL